MYKSIKWLELIGIIFSIIFSFVFHFMYEWIGIFGFIFPVSESVWEHIKIIFMPYLIYSLIEFFIFKPSDKLNFFAIKSISLITMPIVMIVLFYTYSGVIGTNYVAIDILIGIISIIIGYMISLKLLLINYKIKYKIPIITAAGFFLLLIVIFTYYPPNINLFLEK